MKKLVTLLLVVTLVAVVLAVVFGTQKANLNKDLTAANDQITAANTQIADEKKATEEALANANALTKQVAQLEADTAEKASAITTLEGKIAELEQIAAEKVNVEAALTEAQATLKSAQDDLENAKNEKAALEEEFVAAQKAMDVEKENFNAQNTQLNADKAAAELNAANLAAEKAEVEQQIAELEKNKADAEADAAALAVTATELQNTIADLQTKLDAENKNVAELNEKLTAQAADLAARENAFNAAKGELDTAKARIDELEAGAIAASAQVASLNAELSAAKEALDAAKAEAPVEVVILHTNDVHSRVSDNIGYAKLATVVKELEAQTNVILADAGDTLHGMSIATLEEGASIVSILNATGYDVMTPGNHDFNYGYDRLKELEAQMNFPLINATLTLADGSNAFTPYTVLEAGGKKIAFVGACNPQIASSIHPDRISMLTFGGVEKVEAVVSELKGTVDAIVVLCHFGASAAYEPNSSVLAAIDGVDLVIDGHSHTELADIAQTEGSAPVVSTGEYLKNIGKVTLSFDAEGAKVVSYETIAAATLEATVPDAEVEALINNIKTEQGELLAVVVGSTAVDLDGERATNRTEETNLGDLAAEAIRAYTEADFAFTNGGGIRASIPAGDITLKKMVDVFPFGNTVVIIEATGEQILAAMEHGLRAYPEMTGGFPQIAGGTIVFDPAKEAYSRVVEMTIGGEPVDPEKLYNLATNDFLAAGGDGYTALASAKKLMEMGTLDEAFIEYIKEIGVVEIQEDGRISLYVADEEAAPEEGAGA